jgi:alkaline phosphatase D
MSMTIPPFPAVPLYNPVPIHNDTDQNKPVSALICVNYKIATDTALTKVADSGAAYTSSDVDYTLKVRQTNTIV